MVPARWHPHLVTSQVGLITGTHWDHQVGILDTTKMFQVLGLRMPSESGVISHSPNLFELRSGELPRCQVH